METIANQIHPERYQAIRNIVLPVQMGHPEQAKAAVASAKADLPAGSSLPEDVQTLFFLEALCHRLDEQGTEAGNLYLMPDQGQQIRMFNFMAEKFPVVRFSQEIVNAAYQAEMQGETHVVILDIGIGSGQQVARLIEKACQSGSSPEAFTVIGIEPAQDSLISAEKLLLEMAAKYGRTLRFIGVAKAIEALDESDWQRLETEIHNVPGKKLVNASFALHHIRPVSIRATLFARLKKMRPAIFAIIEPYADFLTPDLAKRFDHAWHHYGLTFGAIDRIEASAEEKSTVKQIFFSREIRDVLSEDHQRVEQFETGEMWFERFTQAGFEPYSMPDMPEAIPGCPFVTISHHSSYIGLNVEGYPIISIVAGR